LEKHAYFEAAKAGLIHLSVTDRSAQRASDIANTDLDERYAMNSTLVISEAAQRRLFLDRQLAEEKVAPAAAEDDLKITQERTGLIQLSGQAESIICSIAAQISSPEVQMAAMRTFAIDQNPELTLLQQEVSRLRQQLSMLQNDQHHLAPGNTHVPAGRVPEEGLEYVRKLREVKYHETLFDLLSRQFEAVRIDEAIIQVVDWAVPSDKKARPHRLLITLGFRVVGCLIACMLAYLAQAWKCPSPLPSCRNCR
jgi:tyrosine-protein kinase Etk/Wzc